MLFSGARLEGQTGLVEGDQTGDKQTRPSRPPLRSDPGYSCHPTASPLYQPDRHPDSDKGHLTQLPRAIVALTACQPFAHTRVRRL